MIPILELYLRKLVEDEINSIRREPDIIDEMFSLMDSSYATRFKAYLTKQKINVMFGFPRNDPAVLPCICIMLGSEEEQVEAIGDYEDSFYDETEGVTTDILGTFMRPNFRIECWSDNAELVLFLYSLVKYIFLAKRKKLMEESGITLPRISGGDLEPLAEYFPNFVFRKVVMLSGQIENTFKEGLADDYDSVEVGTEVYDYEGIGGIGGAEDSVDLEITPNKRLKPDDT